MKKKLIILLLSAILTASTVIVAGAAENTDSQKTTQAMQLLQTALTNKTFYDYNEAYAAIMEVKDAGTQNTMLDKLGTISNIVWSSDVKKINKMFDDIVASKGSGRLYDQTEAELRNNKTLAEIDKQYLLGELTSWGRELVYTPEYTKAVDKVVKCWNKLSNPDSDSTPFGTYISDTKVAIDAINTDDSKAYLNEQLDQLKSKGVAKGIYTDNSIPSLKNLQNMDSDSLIKAITGGETQMDNIEPDVNQPADDVDSLLNSGSALDSMPGN